MNYPTATWEVEEGGEIFESMLNSIADDPTQGFAILDKSNEMPYWVLISYESFDKMRTLGIIGEHYSRQEKE